MRGNDCPRCGAPSVWLSTTNQWEYYCPKCGIRFNASGAVVGDDRVQPDPEFEELRRMGQEAKKKCSIQQYAEAEKERRKRNGTWKYDALKTPCEELDRIVRRPFDEIDRLKVAVMERLTVVGFRCGGCGEMIETVKCEACGWYDDIDQCAPHYIRKEQP